MKRNYLWLGIAALVIAGSLWVGRTVWRTRHHIVTLQVRNLPLGEVLAKIERQTGQKIRAEGNLDARITLNLVNKPLAHVLDRVAEQAGAEWLTVYAVYSSSAALNALEKALQGDGKLEPVGWTRIAPNLTLLPMPGPEELGQLASPGPTPQIRKLSPNAGKGAAVMVTEDVVAGPGEGGKRNRRQGEHEPGNHPPIMVRVVRQGGPGGETVSQDVWTPEELVLESALRPRLGDQSPAVATAAEAETTAQTVRGHWTTILAFRKSPMGFNFGKLQIRQSGPGHSGAGAARIVTRGGGAAANQSPAIPPLPGDFENLARQEGNDRFARLTPSQRVQAARQRQGVDQK